MLVERMKKVNEKDVWWVAGTGPAAKGQESATDYKEHTLPQAVRRGVYCDDAWFLGTESGSGLISAWEGREFYKAVLKALFLPNE